MKKSILTFMALLFINTSSYAASFNCSKAVESLDQLICQTPELSKLDDEMAKTYRYALATAIDKISFKEYQPQWLYMRNDCKLNIKCLALAYQQRIGELKNKLPLSPPTIPKEVIEHNWKNIGSFGDSFSIAPEIIFSAVNNNRYLMYESVGDGNLAVVKGDNWSNAVISSFSNDGCVNQATIISSTPDNQLYAAYHYNYFLIDRYNTDNDGSNIMKFDGNRWVKILGLKHVEEVSIAIDNDNKSVYVAYSYTKNKKEFIKVIKENHNKWQTISDSKIVGHNPQITFNASDKKLYMLYQHGDYVASLITFKDKEIVNIALPTTDKKAYSLSLAFNPDTNEPYLAYIDPSKLADASVIKFNGKAWESIGKIVFATDAKPGMMGISDMRLYFNQVSKQPYIAYTYDESLGKDVKHMTVLSKAAIMTFDGKNWKQVGNHVYLSIMPGISLAFSNSGQPYISYIDNNNQTTVARLE